MRYLSICSGIEAASTAWHPLGWSPVAFAEIEPFPCAVLKHHYPDVPNWGDITKFKEWPDAAVDVLVGGTPCQSFSVAGLRAGLADPRGNLALTFLAILDRYRPAWVLYENVPGILSSDGGRDFGAFLGGLGQLGYGWSYRVLDAQYVRTHGHPRAVPQRRRRVFVVGHLGDWRRAAAVLFERESLQGHPAPRRQAGQGTSEDVVPSLVASGRGVERTGETRGQDPVIAQAFYSTESRCDNIPPENISPPLKIGSNGGGQPPAIAFTQPVANPLTHRMHKGINTTMDEGQTMVAHSLTTMGRGGDVTEDGTGRGCPIVPVAHALRADGFDASEDGTYTHEGKNNFRLHNCVATDLRNGAVDDITMSLQGGGMGDERGRCINAIPHIITQEVANPLTARMHKGINTTMDEGQTMVAMGHDGSHANAGGQIAIAFDSKDMTLGADGSTSTLTTNGNENHAGGRLAVAFHENQRGEVIASDAAWAVTVGGGKPGQGYPAVAHPYTLAIRGRGDSHNLEYRTDGTANAVLTPNGGRGGIGVGAVAQGWAVRRLTVEECESLQGFPRGYTQVPYRGKAAADGPRYKALGNSFAVNVVSWIGQRIQMVDDIDKETPDDQAG